MKFKIVLITLSLSLLITKNSFSQAVGNSILSGSKADFESPSPASRSTYGQTQSYGTYQYYAPPKNDSTIIIEGNVLMNVKADSYLAILGVAQVSSTLDSASNLINNRISSFINNLKTLGIQSSDIYVDLISQVPLFTIEVEKKIFSKTYNEVPSGFELRKNIHILYKDCSVLDKILIEGAKNEIYDIVKVDYYINNFQSIYDSLRKVTTNIISKKAEAFSKLGVKFSPAQFNIISEEINSSYPIEHYKSYSAFSDVSANFIKKKSLSSVNYTPAIKPVTVYYNKEAYNKYDEVINPVILEPEVQFSYNLKLQYTLKKQ